MANALARNQCCQGTHCRAQGASSPSPPLLANVVLRGVLHFDPHANGRGDRSDGAFSRSLGQVSQLWSPTSIKCTCYRLHRTWIVPIRTSIGTCRLLDYRREHSEEMYSHVIDRRLVQSAPVLSV